MGHTRDIAFLQADFFSCQEDNDTSYTDSDEAIEHYLGATDPKHWEPETIAYAWTRVKAADKVSSKVLVACVLEFVLEELDVTHELGHPDRGTTPDAAMRAATEAYVDAMLKAYEPWHCTRTPAADVTVNTAAWVRENVPDWLEDGADVDEIRAAIARLEGGTPT